MSIEVDSMVAIVRAEIDNDEKILAEDEVSTTNPGLETLLRLQPLNPFVRLEFSMLSNKSSLRRTVSTTEHGTAST